MTARVHFTKGASFTKNLTLITTANFADVKIRDFVTKLAVHFNTIHLPTLE